MLVRIFLILMAASFGLCDRLKADEISTEVAINVASTVQDVEILKKWYTYNAEQLGGFVEQGRVVIIPAGSVVEFSKNVGYWTVSVQGEGTYFTLQTYVTAATPVGWVGSH
jgi:hypothetical protein